MPEKQVLFRIEAKLLDSLDKKLAKDGYSTRNAWFKDAVAAYAGRGSSSSKTSKKRR
ncbi:MAG TPA: hypothetical protein VFH78_01285 [Candidatus Thermoplasmatota archaeon]|nr:hypothetical protein [Candidatus Thermoplasmatota archaeon]